MAWARIYRSRRLSAKGQLTAAIADTPDLPDPLTSSLIALQLLGGSALLQHANQCDKAMPFV